MPSTPSSTPELSPTAMPAVPAATSLDVSDERRHLATRVLGDAILLGVVGDAIMRSSTLGANMSVWTVAVVLALITLARRRHDAMPAEARWLLAPTVAIALLFAWRQSESLAAYNALALVGTLGLLASAVRASPDQALFTSRVRDVAQRLFSVGLGTAFGMPRLVVVDVSLRDVTTGRGSTRIVTGLRTALLAIPLLLVFGGLFTSADPVFARVVGDVFAVDAGEVATHLVLTGFFAWIVGGFLRSALLSSSQAPATIPFPDGALGITEVSVTLGSLVLLFAAFVAVQFRYFFGGDAVVVQTAGLGYADYARSGFFELVTVSALVLPVLLSANALLRRDTPRAVKIYRWLATTLLVLLAVIMYSAVTRMRLYQSVYGLSTDRLDATVFMAWLALVFVWFSFTVLRGRDKPFVAGVLISAWGTLFTLNVADPAGLVARANIARADRGKDLDVRYIESLGADAAPALVSYLVRQPLTPPPGWASPSSAQSAPGASTPNASMAPMVPREASGNDYTARCRAARKLLEAWGPSAPTDWRGWTAASATARRVIAKNQPALRTLAGTEWVGKTYVRCAEAPAAVSMPPASGVERVRP